MLLISPVKVIFAWFAAILTIHASPSDPGTAALNFLEKVRLRQLDLAPGTDTALSAQVLDAKKHKIARRLDRLANELSGAQLEVGAVKTDENFAAVLVRKVGGLDPSSFRIFPVALVKRGESWTPAPVPASFENVDIGYVATLRSRLSRLEDWMLREQVTDLETLRARSHERLRQKIQAKLPINILRTLTPLQVTEKFLTACQQRDSLTLLGLLGGLSSPLPSDWPRILNAADQLVDRDSRPSHLWRLLGSPEVARIVVQHQEDREEGLCSIAFLDPAGAGKTPSSPRFERVDLKLTRCNEQLWRIDLPNYFWGNSAAAEENTRTTAEASDSDWFHKFPKLWQAAHPSEPQPTAQMAYDRLVSAFHSDSLGSMLSLSKLDGDGKSATATCLQAAKLWWTLHSPTAVRHSLPLAFHTDGDAAAGVFQFCSAREPDRFDIRVAIFEKTADGWLWNPLPDSTTREPFDSWIDQQAKHWPTLWQEQLLANSIQLPLGPTLKLVPPSPAEAEKLITQWLTATRNRDVVGALAFTCRFNDARSDTLLFQNLGYEISGARQQTQAPIITGTYLGATWVGVGVKIEQAGKFTFPFYPVVQTQTGPRILAEIDLFASANRSREFLNKTAVDRLQKLTSATVADEFRNLYLKHQATLEKVSPSIQPRPRLK